MRKLLIVPDKANIEEYIKLAEEYGVGFEYNEFYAPDLLDDEVGLKETIDFYKLKKLPAYCTMHGAFMDVVPFSADSKIRQISNERIEQSLEIAKTIGAKAVVFHTNYNPLLNAKTYIKSWLETNTKYWATILEKYSEINIYLENMFDDSYEIIQKMSEELSKYANYGVCLDYSHASLTHREPAKWAKELGRYVKHIHINDNDGVTDLHLAWGDGVMDREEFYNSYWNYMENATILLETRGIENARRSLDRLVKDGFYDKFRMN